MTRDDLIRLADLAGYDVDEDEVYAPAAGRYGLDPKLVHFAQLVAAAALSNKKARWYQEGFLAGQREERLKQISNLGQEIDVKEKNVP
jgi:hypothetical protein